MATTKCKTCRRTGQKLFLKEDKCASHKCPMIRKPYAPGKKVKRMKPISEYGSQLKEKQKLKFLYGLQERQFSNYVKKAMRKGGLGIGTELIKFLESRLDNVVFRTGFAKSRSEARQMVGHGHICVNNRKVSTPSLAVKKGDKISIRKQSQSKSIFIDLDTFFKKYSPPSWLKLDKGKKEGEVARTVSKEDIDWGISIDSIIGFYSR